MVSIRKRRHLGLLERHKVLSQISRINGQHEPLDPNVRVVENSGFERSIAEPLEYDVDMKPALEAQVGSSVFSGSSSSKDMKNLIQERELKRRKRQRRKHFENQEACMLRGVYFKNMKWQAAIKVEKKQIHLGTVSSMEEAAHLYDRAAYMCGREPNFELSEEEKQELQGIQWEEFLDLTRKAIANKKRQKKIDASLRRKQATGFGGSSPSP